jgi:mono/diheme cytochrome c family protein
MLAAVRAGVILIPLFAGTALADPKADYLLHCGGCHRPDASGVPPSVPPLAGALGRIAATPEGRDYIVRVPGASQTPLSDEALAAVMNWVLLTYNADTLPAGFKPLSGREVGRSRKNVLADPQQMRETLWPDY